MRKKFLLFFAVLFVSMASAQSFSVDGVNYFVISAANRTVGVNASASYVGALVVPSTVSNASVDYTVVSILDSAFENSTTLTSIVIPSTVTEIRNGAFRFCTNLTSVTIPNSVTWIGQLSFNACYSLTSVVIPNSVTTIGIEGFALCTGLTSLTISNSLTSFSVGVFQNCTSLTSLTIPSSVTSLGQDAIRGCSGLTSVTIPSSVTSISNTVFMDCTALTSVKVNWATPLAITANVFQNVNIGAATLNVPVGTVALYQGAPVWQNFGTIVQPLAATHLNFGATTDYVDCGNKTSLQITGNKITLEAYVKFNSFTTDISLGNIISKDDVNGNGYLLRAGGNGVVNFVIGSTVWNELFTPANSISINQWHHIAGVYDGVTQKIYVDGIEVASQPLTVNIGNAYTNLTLGKDSYFQNRYLDASLDDVRIWNIARTETQIAGSKNCELQGNETGLVAYYKFNQGFDSQNNSSITTLTDATANANNGTLTNFALTGTSSNWLAGSPVMTGSIIPSVATVTTPVVYNQNETVSTLTATTGANGTGLVWYTTATGGMGTSTAPTPSTATAGSTSYWVSSKNANGCESDRTEIVVTVKAQVPATHLNFDGANDCAQIPTGINIANSSFTIEFYAKHTLSNTNDYVFNQGYYSTNSNLHIGFRDNNNFLFAFYNNDLNISSINYISDNAWHLWTCVYNNTDGSREVYQDGILVGSQTGVTPYSGNGALQIGSQGNYQHFYDGSLDEIRIWNTARTSEQINASKNCELQGTETGLVAYYKFNQGFDSQNNSSITTLTDATANANNGTLTNFALTGTSSNWLSGSPVMTGSTCATLSASTFEVSSKLKMYPNPTTNNITIDIADLTNVQLEVLDITGKVLKNQALKNQTNSIDLSQLPKGIYLFKATATQGSTVSKVIKN